jgi:predicted O-methyltransferase YrrM
MKITTMSAEMRADVIERCIRPTEARLLWEMLPADTDLVRVMMAFKRNTYHHLSYLYAFVRYVARRFPGTPLHIVETGVQEGGSSAFVLQALADEGNDGHLWSIDLPNAVYTSPMTGQLVDETLPDYSETGFLVSQSLRSRWTLVLGDTREKLEAVLADAGTVHVFHHDSEHTLAVMQFEFGAAWPRIPVGGILAADDALWTTSLDRFAKQVGHLPSYAQNVRHPGVGGFILREHG